MIRQTCWFVATLGFLALVCRQSIQAQNTRPAGTKDQYPASGPATSGPANPRNPATNPAAGSGPATNPAKSPSSTSGGTKARPANDASGASGKSATSPGARPTSNNPASGNAATGKSAKGGTVPQGNASQNNPPAQGGPSQGSPSQGKSQGPKTLGPEAQDPASQAAQGPSTPRGVRGQPQQPNWIPLSAENQKFVDDVLRVWEQKSSSVERFRCSFTRFRYLPAFGPYVTNQDGKPGELRPATREQGVIFYKSPDKGMIRVDKIERNQLKVGSPDDRWTATSDPGDYWLCDGKSLFYLNHVDKKLIEQPLPSNMQGKFISNGPLPFIFGAQASQVKSRFWIRPRAAESKNEVKLEFVPKTTADASDFARVQVILEETENHEVLPKAIRIINNDDSEESYVFVDREYNWNELLEKIKRPFEREFDKPVTPKGYQKVVEQALPDLSKTPETSKPQAQAPRPTPPSKTR